MVFYLLSLLIYLFRNLKFNKIFNSLFNIFFIHTPIHLICCYPIGQWFVKNYHIYMGSQSHFILKNNKKWFLRTILKSNFVIYVWNRVGLIYIKLIQKNSQTHKFLSRRSLFKHQTLNMFVVLGETLLLSLLVK